MIHEDISYNDLIVAVLEDFGIDGNINSGNLSYASPSKLNFGTKELPPVFIRNDRQVTSYLNKLKENGDLHLCVTIKSRGEVLINHDLPIAGNSNPLERETQISLMIVSNMVQTQDEVLITNDLPIAGSRNFCQTQDEISSTHDSPIARSSNVFERGKKTHPETKWNNIQRVYEVSGIQLLVLEIVLFILQVVLLAIREDWTRWDLLYMGLE
ncbi:hypothetical protein HID58_042308, partial [Brassica napus]